MRDGTNTRIWAGAKGTQHSWPQIPFAECPSCHRPTAGQPFCDRDGTLTGTAPFSIGGRYIVDDVLGAGGMAFVFAARHEVLGKPVALKVLRREVAQDPTQAQRFLREARIASQVHHEAIVNVLDFGHDSERGLHYLVMERLNGRTLSDIIDASSPLPWRRTAPILIQLARALEAAHAQGVAHRDLTPRNVMLVASSGRADVVKLCDFGLSRLSGHVDRVTSTGTFLGTPAYAAPEQIRGDVNQDHRVDIYALASLAYEMLTGKLPYAAPTSVALIAAKLTSDPIPPNERTPGIELPPALEAWLLESLQRDPAARTASAAETARILGALLAGPDAGRARGSEDLIGQTIGSYRVVSRIGSGGVGTVYLGEHPVIGNRVAIKVLQPEVLGVTDIVERFIEESRASSQIGSPHIARCHDFGFLTGGQPYAIMEFLEGETLGERLRRTGPLDVAKAAELGRQVAKALEQAHGAGIIHRDIKPENLMVVRGDDGGDLIKVLDFGIAKLHASHTNGGAGAARKTSHGFVLGTPYYCAPEQLLGEEVSPATDVYALGATLFELLTGQPPFDGSLSEIAAAKLSKEPPLASDLRADIPATVAADIVAMLATDPFRRPASMREVDARLTAWARAGLASPRAASIHSDDSTALAPAKRGAWRAAVAGIVVTLGTVIALAATADDAPSTTPSQPVVAPAPAKVIAPRPATPATVAPAPVTPTAVTTHAPEPPPASMPKSVAAPPPTVVAPAKAAHVVQSAPSTPAKASLPSTTNAKPTSVKLSSGIIDPFNEPPPKSAPKKPSNDPLIVNPFHP